MLQYSVMGTGIIRYKLFLPFFLFFTILLWPQSAHSSVNDDEQFSYIGMTLTELIERFGSPVEVSAVRGNEPWQDDVVFRYSEGDFYIHLDRVWQVKFESVYGITNRDRKVAVLSALGNTAEDMGDYVLFPVTGKDWPLMLRVNFNSSGFVSAIYLYRPDF